MNPRIHSLNPGTVPLFVSIQHGGSSRQVGYSRHAIELNRPAIGASL